MVYIEAALLPGGTGVRVTGARGENIEDQVLAAQSHVWSHAAELGIHPRLFRRYALHVHAPVGADHAAAGLGIVVALVSIYNGYPVASEVAITGATTLAGLVLSVPAIRERVIAARLAGFGKIILPRDNEKDLAPWTDSELAGVSLVFVDRIQDALEATVPGLMNHLAALKPSL